MAHIKLTKIKKQIINEIFYCATKSIYQSDVKNLKNDFAKQN